MKKIMFLRGADVNERIGTTDVEVVYELQDLGNEVILFLSGNRQFLSKQTRGGVQEVVVLRPKIPVIGGLLFNIFTFFAMIPYDAEVVILNAGMFMTASLYKLVRSGTAFVLDVRSIPVDVKGLYGRFLELIFTVAVSLPHYDGMTVITKNMDRYLKDNYRTRKHTPIGIWSSACDDSLFVPQKRDNSLRERFAPESSTLFVYHGTVTKSRGIDNLILAIYRLVQDGVEDARLILIGDGRDLSYMKKIAEKYDLDGYVRFTGVVPYKEVPRYLAIADCAVVPLPDHKWWRYSSPLKIYEYFAMRIPVIATDIQAHREFSRVIISVPNNEESTLSRAMKNFMAFDLEDRMILSERMIRFARKNTWKERAKQLDLYLSTLMEGKRKKDAPKRSVQPIRKLHRRDTRVQEDFTSEKKGI